jgi:hypothetical protein
VAIEPVTLGSRCRHCWDVLLNGAVQQPGQTHPCPLELLVNGRPHWRCTDAQLLAARRPLACPRKPLTAGLTLRPVLRSQKTREPSLVSPAPADPRRRGIPDPHGEQRPIRMLGPSPPDNASDDHPQIVSSGDRGVRYNDVDLRSVGEEARPLKGLRLCALNVPSHSITQRLERHLQRRRCTSDDRRCTFDR